MQLHGGWSIKPCIPLLFAGDDIATMKNLKKKVLKKFEEDPLEDYLVTDEERLDKDGIVTRKDVKVDKAKQHLATRLPRNVPAHKPRGARGSISRSRTTATGMQKSVAGGSQLQPQHQIGRGLSAPTITKPSGDISGGKAIGSSVTNTRVTSLAEVEKWSKVADENNPGELSSDHSDLMELMNANRSHSPTPPTSSSSAAEQAQSSSSSPSSRPGSSHSGSANTTSSLDAAILGSLATNPAGSTVTVVNASSSENFEILAKFMWRFTPAAENAARAMGFGPNVVPRKRILELYAEAG